MSYDFCVNVLLYILCIYGLIIWLIELMREVMYGRYSKQYFRDE